jgi:hypothetical protein
MITKLATFRGVSPSGEPLVWAYKPGNKELEKLAGDLHPEIQKWLANYKPNKNEIALLVNALGASEYWGQNVNGDYFSWPALVHYCNVEKLAGLDVVDKTGDLDSSIKSHPTDDFTGRPIPPYGYATFLQAHPFAHHKNKDPNRAFGKVAISVLNHKMRRVELVVIIDKAKAREFGAQHILDRIEAGEYPDVSMGCRVPYDVCLICGNKSKTRADYCSCVKEIGMNKILDDGRQIGVDNLYPRFFDISFVFIGADKTAKTMAKLASGLYVPQSVADAEELYGPSSDDGLLKAACGAGICHECARGCHVKEAGGLATYGRYIDDVADLAIIAARKRNPTDDKPKFKLIPKPLVKSAAIVIGPPPVKNREEFPYVGTINFRGLKIMVENKPGDVREGTDSNGKKWQTKMHFAYGEILGTMGTDKDRLDVYVGPNENAENVHIVHQNHPTTHPTKAGKYDEDKVMLGFDSSDDAVEAYLKQYTRKDFFRSVTTMAFPLFANMIKGEVKGEKVASLEKVAGDMRLEDLFEGAATAVRRERTWRDEVTKKESHRTGSGFDSFDQMKTASVVDAGIDHMLRDKTAAKRKIADILKQVDPTGTTGQVVQNLSERESSLPTEVLDQLGEGDLSKALSTTSGMGMVLKPHEFQRIVMIRLGHKDTADDMDSRDEVFPPVHESSPLSANISPENFSSKIMSMLMPFMENRSYMEPVMKRRIIRITITKPVTDQTKIATSPLLTKIGAAYNWYRNELMKLAATQWDQIVTVNPTLHSAVNGVDDMDIFSMKMAAEVPANLGGLPAAASLGVVPLILLASAHLRSDQEAGEHLGFLDDLVANHPYLSTLGGAAAAREFFKTRMGEALLKKVMSL